MTFPRSLSWLAVAGLVVVAPARADAEDKRFVNIEYDKLAARTQSTPLGIDKFQTNTNLGVTYFECWGTAPAGCNVSTYDGRVTVSEVTFTNLGGNRMRLVVKLPQPKTTLVYTFETVFKK